MEILTDRLLALRAEIDVILAQLARIHATPAEAANPHLAAPHAAEADAPPADEAYAAVPEPADIDQPLLTSAPEAEVATEPEMDAANVAIEDAPATDAGPVDAEMPPAAPVETDMTSAEADAEPPSDPVPADDAVETTAAVEPETIESPMAEPAMTAASPAADAPAAATVVSLDAHRPSRRAPADATEPAARWNRRSRTKIAACILGGLALAGLAFADLSALGSAPTPPGAASSATLLGLEGFPVSADRYRAAWPSGS